MHCRIRPALFAVVVTGTSLFAAPARAAAACPTGAIHTYGRWSEIDLPQFPAVTASRAARPMTMYAVDAAKPGRLFVSDGDTVFRSADGGCTWKQVYQVPVRSVSATRTTSVETIVAPGGDRVYLGLVEGYDGAGRLDVLVSTDGGATFASVGSGLPPVVHDGSTAGRLIASTKDPKRVYLSASPLLFVSKDGGASWSESTGFTTMTSTATTVLVAVDPANADVVYAWVSGTAGLLRSVDAGTTFTRISEQATISGASGLGFVHVPGAPELLMTDGKALSGCSADCSRNGALPGPKNVTAVVASSGVAAVLATSAGLYTYNAKSGVYAPLVNPFGVGSGSPQADRAAKPSFWSSTDVNLYRYSG